MTTSQGSVNKISLEELRLLSYQLSSTDLNGGDAAGRLLTTAKIDANPHQIEAALRGYRSLAFGGIFLGDEVGLGKTIEAGLIIKQLWLEDRRNILVIAPVALLGQWQSELDSLFNLNCRRVDSNISRKLLSEENPILQGLKGIFLVPDSIVLKFEKQIRSRKWDMVVIDEAHRYRSIVREERNSKSFKLREIFQGAPKLLLTATPMQNHPAEMIGLASYLSDEVYGSALAALNSKNANSNGYVEALRNRIKPFMQRTLRRHVSSYLYFPDRLVHDFDYMGDERRTKVTEKLKQILEYKFLLLDSRNAFSFQKTLLLKLFASSTPNLTTSLENSVRRMIELLAQKADRSIYERLKTQVAQRCEWLVRQRESAQESGLDGEFDLGEDDAEDNSKRQWPRSADLEQQLILILDVIEILRDAEHVGVDAKIDAVLKCVNAHFEGADRKGFPKKIVIFTEYVKTLNLLKKHLTDHLQGVCVLEFSGQIGKTVQTSRELIVQTFRQVDSGVLLCTEAGAEGLNLQFCNAVLNFDLPWNPQRIEQRIGRCHRLNQKYDVLVYNLVDLRNPGERHVYSILKNKLNVFVALFDQSNDILGDLVEDQNAEALEVLLSEVYLGLKTEKEVEEFIFKFEEQAKVAKKEGLLKRAKEFMDTFDDEMNRLLKGWDDIRKEAASFLSKFESRALRFLVGGVPGAIAEKARLIIPFGSLGQLGGCRVVFDRARQTGDDLYITIDHPEITSLIESIQSTAVPDYSVFETSDTSILHSADCAKDNAVYLSAWCVDYKGLSTGRLIKFFSHHRDNSNVAIVFKDAFWSAIKSSEKPAPFQMPNDDELKKGLVNEIRGIEEKIREEIILFRWRNLNSSIQDLENGISDLEGELKKEKRDIEARFLAAPVAQKKKLLDELAEIEQRFGKKIDLLKEQMKILEAQRLKAAEFNEEQQSIAVNKIFGFFLVRK